jgi:hypothetical protein
LIGFFAFLLLAACSAEGAVKSKRSVLEPRLAQLREARKTAAAFKPEAALPASADPVVSGKAPYEESNTLVITDEEIDSFGHEVDCAALAMTGTGASCRGRLFGAGNDCAMNVASVLEHDHFKDKDAPHARASAQKCADWLSNVKYVLVVHIDAESFRGSTAATYAKGKAVLVELASGKALGKIGFDVSSHEELGGTTYTKSGREARFVTRQATSTDALVQNELGAKLQSAFPAANVARWILK